MFRFNTGRAFAMAGLSVLMLGSAVQAQYDTLIRRIPSGANVLVLVDIEKLLGTPLAVKEQWKDKYEAQFQAGMVVAPPQTEHMVMAAHLDLQFMQSHWQVTLMDLNHEPNFVKLAAARHGSIDSIGGLAAVVLPGDVYAIQFAPKIAGVMTPANRQAAGRWVTQIKNDVPGQLSPYLDEAVKFAERGAPIIMAMDLEHALAPEEIRHRLAGFAALEGKKVDLEALSTMLASIRGVSLGITVSEKRFGKIKVDFNSDLKLSDALAKAILLEVLGRRGVMISEFLDWTVKVSARQISLEGNLEASGMRRILSILDAPPSLHTPTPSKSNNNDPEYEKQLVALSSKKYFQSIVSLLDDLRNQNNAGSVSTTGLVAQWYERYARKIDGLHSLDVDPELLEYGSYVSDTLRGSEHAMKAVGPESRMAENAVQPTYNVQTWSNPIGVTRWGAYGNYGWSATRDMQQEGADMAKGRMQARMRGYSTAGVLMQGVAEATGDVRRKMTQKYRMEF